jgi:outer membrane protein assembly factor BamB
MSLSVDALGNLLVLDQVNGRLVRLDAEGKVVGTFSTTQQVPQDVVVARDGKLLVLDRLVDRTVAILDPDTGRLLGELPVGGANIDDPGLVTGIFEYEGSVYVEREHGALVRIGDTTGKVDTERPELPGRISRDGRFLMLTSIIERETGRVLLNLIDRPTNQHRYTRELRLQFRLWNIVLLDTDLSGIIHLGVMGEVNPNGLTPAEQLGMRLYCIDPLEGQVLGQTELPISHLAEESFRDYQVLNEGGIVYQLRTEQGVALRRASCR